MRKINFIILGSATAIISIIIGFVYCFLKSEVTTGYFNSMPELQKHFGLSCKYLDFNTDGKIYYEAIRDPNRGVCTVRAFGRVDEKNSLYILSQDWGNGRFWPRSKKSRHYDVDLPPELEKIMHPVVDDKGWYIEDHSEDQHVMCGINSDLNVGGLVQCIIEENDCNGELLYSCTDGRIILTLLIYTSHAVTKENNQ